jgi:hypothetical protein
MEKETKRKKSSTIVSWKCKKCTTHDLPLLECHRTANTLSPLANGGQKVIFDAIMTRIPFILVAFTILVQLAFGQSAETDWLQHVIPTKERSFDFKTVAKGATPEYPFVLKNPLQEPIHIASVVSSCACTTLDFDAEKTVLQTYETFELKVRLRGDRFEGQRNSTLTVIIDKPHRAEIQLNVRGEIRADLKVTPDFLDFGNVVLEKGPSKTLTVTYSGSNSHWRIVDARCENPCIRANITTDFTNINQKTFKVQVSFDPSTPFGTIREHLFLVTNDGASRREIPIDIRATVGTVIRVSPPTVFLGALPSGEPSPTKPVILTGTTAFRITKIECDNPAINIVWEADAHTAPQDRYRLPISYQNPAQGEGAPQKDGTMLATVRVTTDVPGLVSEFYVTMSVQKNSDEE